MQAMKKFQNLGKNIFKTSQIQSQLQKHSKVGIQVLLSGIFVLGNQYRMSQQNQEVHALSPKDLSGEGNQKEQIQFEQFTEKAYQEAIKNKCDIIIIVEPDRFREDFLEEIRDYLKNFRNMQKVMDGRQLKFFKTSFASKQEIQEFQKKYNTKIERDTLLLLKNQYMDVLYDFGSYDWFENREYMFKYFREITQINDQNYQKFLGVLGELSSENVILLGYSDKKSAEFEKHQKKFGIISLLKEYSENPAVYCMLVNDKKVAQDLGLDTDGGVYLMQKSSKFNYKASNKQLNGIKFQILQSAHLSDNLIKLMDKNTETYVNNNVFSAKSFDSGESKYSFVLEVNENQMNKKDSKKLIDLIGKLKKKVQEVEKDQGKIDITFVKLNRANKQRKYTIYMRDDVKAMNRIRAHSAVDIKEIKELEYSKEPHSYQYQYPDTQPLEVDSVFQWFNQVLKGQAEEQFKSAEAPYYRKYSKKLVSSTFEKEVQKSSKNQAVFLYSKHCHACRQYGGLYEELGLECMKKGENLEFNRMNSDGNILKTSENFPYTPVFQIFKTGAKEGPYVYRHQRFTPDMLKDFCMITSQFKLIPEFTFEHIFENYQKPEFVEQQKLF